MEAAITQLCTQGLTKSLRKKAKYLHKKHDMLNWSPIRSHLERLGARPDMVYSVVIIIIMMTKFTCNMPYLVNSIHPKPQENLLLSEPGTITCQTAFMAVRLNFVLLVLHFCIHETTTSR